MAGKSQTTTDHQVIQKWVEDRGGRPATVKRTGDQEDPGILRINFPGVGAEDSLQDISWNEFFKKFDEKHLAFLYQDTLRDGETSRFFKFVSQETAENKNRGKSQRETADAKSKAKRETADVKSKAKRPAASKSKASESKPKTASRATGDKARSRSRAR